MSTANHTHDHAVHHAAVVRLQPNQLPHNHHDHPVAPLQASGEPYLYCWRDTSRGELVYAATAEDLLDEWLPGYLEQDDTGRARLRAQHAIQLRDHLAAELVADADQRDDVDLSADDEQLLLTDLSELPDIARWDSPVPLVLLDGMYRPFTTRIAPISGIDGDVHEPTNILWLRNSHPDAYVQSLARAGIVQLDVHG